MNYYKCEICHKKHDFFGNISCPEPSLISNMSEEDQARRIHREGSLVIVDRKRIFINGTIYIALAGESEWLSIQVWVNVKKEEFLKVAAIVERGEKIPALSGTLESEFMIYENTKNLNVQIYMYESVADTRIEVIEENHPLSIDQRAGIDRARLIELTQMIYHNPKYQTKKNSGESFEILLSKALEEAESVFIKKGKNFGISIFSGSEIVFQLICNRLLEKQEPKEIGFAIDIALDQTSEEHKEELLRLKKSKYFKELDYHLLNEIPIFQKDIGKDKSKISTYVKGLLKDVFEVEKEEVSFDVFEIEQ